MTFGCHVYRASADFNFMKFSFTRLRRAPCVNCRLRRCGLVREGPAQRGTGGLSPHSTHRFDGLWILRGCPEVQQ